MMYRMFIIAAGAELEIPVLPPKIVITTESRNKKKTVLETGDVLKLGRGGLRSVEWESFFPLHNAPYVTGVLTQPMQAVRFLQEARQSLKPVRFLAVGGDYDINMRMGIDTFDYEERFGEVGDIYYRIKLTEWRSTAARRVTISTDTMTAVISEPPRPGEPNLPKTYTVVEDDTLWLIAKRYYDDGSRYPEIYNANKAVIDAVNHKWGNPKYTIYPGQVFVIP